MQIPFNMTITGKAGTGKTTFIKKLYKEELFDKFDRVILYSVMVDNFDFDPKIERFSDYSTVVDMLQKMKCSYNPNQPKVLFIFDDCTDPNYVELFSLNNNISTIIVNQWTPYENPKHTLVHMRTDCKYNVVEV